MPHLQEWYNCCGAYLMYSVERAKPTEQEFQRLYSQRGTKAVICFIDNDTKAGVPAMVNGKYVLQDPFNGGEEWAKFIRSKGYRVDQIWLGGNPNHGESVGHKLTLYIWYVNSQKDKESVIIGEQPKKPILPNIADAGRSLFGRTGT